jgi:probable DNA repair protein
LELTKQFKTNKINTELFNQVVCSVYIKGYQLERSARHLLANKANSLALEYFSLAKLKNAFKHCPILLEIINQLKTLATNTQTLSQHLLSFNEILNYWGFATDRNLSSSEYQLFQKYLSSALKLNQLSLHQKKCSSNIALQRLKEITNQVVFQAQSSKANIQIIGALEAEGLHFDKAWVMGITHNFLPAKLNSAKFISSSIAIAHKIPFSSYELIQSDGKDTLKNLSALASMVIFSYAKYHFESEQLPSPLLDFPIKSQEQINTQTTVIKSELINDIIIPKVEELEVKSGVALLKDQMSCAFKGFTHRLKITRTDEPHIGLDRREQGNIIHNSLQYIYAEVNSKDALLALNKTELKELINLKINEALKHYPDSELKNIEKIRVAQLLFKFIEVDKTRENFHVLATERSVAVNIAGLNFNTRLDRLDEMDNGDKIVFDYKTGSTSISKWCATNITEPQLPIYSVTNNTQGAAFIELNSNGVSFKGLSKDPDSLPKQSTRKGNCQDWNKQVITWKNQLDRASQDFQSGQVQVAPNKTACDYCEFDLLCRIQK